MIDVHAHFADEGYEFPAEWEKIIGMGVGKVILAADTLAHAQWHAKFAEAHEGCYFTVGIHPSEAKEGLTRAVFADEFRALAGMPKCVAVGEIGLDYHYPDPDRRLQRKLFVEQLECAGGLPVQIHSRDACADTLAVLKEHRELLKGGFLMHCYSYGRENLDAFCELGGYFSFGGVVCFKNARRAVESAEACPMDRILSETDSPYLSPFRGEKNGPENIPVIVEKLASIKGVSPFEMAGAIADNAARLFPKCK